MHHVKEWQGTLHRPPGDASQGDPRCISKYKYVHFINREVVRETSKRSLLTLIGYTMAFEYKKEKQKTCITCKHSFHNSNNKKVREKEMSLLYSEVLKETRQHRCNRRLPSGYGKGMTSNEELFLRPHIYSFHSRSDLHLFFSSSKH